MFPFQTGETLTGKTLSSRLVNMVPFQTGETLSTRLVNMVPPSKQEKPCQLGFRDEMLLWNVCLVSAGHHADQNHVQSMSRNGWERDREVASVQPKKASPGKA
jgi:hypothetical protein